VLGVDVAHLGGHDAQGLALEAADDLAAEPPLDGIRFTENKSP
jgi:hypothetical protein